MNMPQLLLNTTKPTLVFCCKWHIDHYDELWDLYKYILSHKENASIIFMSFYEYQPNPNPYFPDTQEWVIRGKCKPDWTYDHKGYNYGDLQTLIEGFRAIPLNWSNDKTICYFDVRFHFNGIFNEKDFANRILMAKVAGFCLFDNMSNDNRIILSYLNKELKQED